jgi:hypothetical protein
MIRARVGRIVANRRRREQDRRCRPAGPCENASVKHGVDCGHRRRRRPAPRSAVAGSATYTSTLRKSPRSAAPVRQADRADRTAPAPGSGCRPGAPAAPWAHAGGPEVRRHHHLPAAAVGRRGAAPSSSSASLAPRSDRRRAASPRSSTCRRRCAPENTSARPPCTTADAWRISGAGPRPTPRTPRCAGTPRGCWPTGPDAGSGRADGRRRRRRSRPRRRSARPVQPTVVGSALAAERRVAQAAARDRSRRPARSVITSARRRGRSRSCA